MEFYCTNRFEAEFNKLKSHNKYKEIEADIISYFFQKKQATDFQSGQRLNGHNPDPYIKKRLEGSGGFRIYYYLLIKNGKLFLMFVHPKTGSEGYENIGDEFKASIYKDVLDDIKNKTYLKVKYNAETKAIEFEKLSKEKFAADNKSKVEKNAVSKPKKTQKKGKGKRKK